MAQGKTPLYTQASARKRWNLSVETKSEKISHQSHNFNCYLLAFCTAHNRKTRQYWGRNWKVYQVVFYCTMSVIIGSKLTLHHKINPFRHGWRDIVAGDTKIGAHVLPPHLKTSLQSPPMTKSATLWISKRLLWTTSTIRCWCWAFLDLIFRPPSRFQAIFGWGRRKGFTWSSQAC